MNIKEKAQPEQQKVIKNRRTGILMLFVAIILNVLAQLILKEAAKEIGPFVVGQEDVWHYAMRLIHPVIILGLGLFGMSIIAWIMCLSRLDLSFAYPVATVQYFLIFGGAWYFFDEKIPFIRIFGLIIIAFGVIIISFDKGLE